MRRFKHGSDVDLGALGDDIELLGREVKEGDVVIREVGVEQDVPGSDIQQFALTITFSPSEGSAFYDGYTIPYDD